MDALKAPIDTQSIAMYVCILVRVRNNVTVLERDWNYDYLQ